MARASRLGNTEQIWRPASGGQAAGLAVRLEMGVAAQEAARGSAHAAQATFAAITAAQTEAGVAEVSLLNFAVSDGATLIATRYVSHEHEEAASLYYAEGSAFQARLQLSPAQ